jgi:hypothetical protein
MIDNRYACSPGAGSAEVDAESGEQAFDGSGQNPNTWHPLSPVGNGWIGNAPPVKTEAELEFSRLRALWVGVGHGVRAARRS